MSKGKIAPDVVPVLENTADLCHGGRVIAARKQARALLAVARAAERFAERVELEGSPYSEDAGLLRALSRLRRASGTGRGKA